MSNHFLDFSTVSIGFGIERRTCIYQLDNGRTKKNCKPESIEESGYQRLAFTEDKKKCCIVSYMADNKKPLRFTPKKPDRELYVPRHRKQTVKKSGFSKGSRNQIAVVGEPTKISESCNQQVESKAIRGNEFSDSPFENGCAIVAERNEKFFLKCGQTPHNRDIAKVKGLIGEDKNETSTFPSAVLNHIEKAYATVDNLLRDPDEENKPAGASTDETSCCLNSAAENSHLRSFDFQRECDQSLTLSEKAKFDKDSPYDENKPQSGPSFVTMVFASKSEISKAENTVINVDKACEDHLISDGNTNILNERKTLNPVKGYRKIKIHKNKKKSTNGQEERLNKAKNCKESNAEDLNLVEEDQTVEDDDWFDKWDETGNCLGDEAKEELAKLTKIENPLIVEARKPDVDYLSFHPQALDLDSKEFGHLTEVYDFSPDFTTTDLSLAFQTMGLKDFDIKWVDGTHAIGIFSTTFQAQLAVKSSSLVLKIRPISEGTKETQQKVKSFKDMLLPYKSRPETTAVVARNMVTSALGVKTNTTKEQRAAERRTLAAAKERKRLMEQLAKDTWGE